MVGRGRVHKGVVVLDDPGCFPEGQEVTVLASATTLAQPAPNGAPRSVLDVRCVSLGPLRHLQMVDDDLLGEMLEGRA